MLDSSKIFVEHARMLLIYLNAGLIAHAFATAGSAVAYAL